MSEYTGRTKMYSDGEMRELVCKRHNQRHWEFEDCHMCMMEEEEPNPCDGCAAPLEACPTCEWVSKETREKKEAQLVKQMEEETLG